MLKIVEIEGDQHDYEHKHDDEPTEPTARRVSFKDNSNGPSSELRNSQSKSSRESKRKGGRGTSPPPDPAVAATDSDSDDYVFDDLENDNDDDDDDEDPALSLTRFTSASAKPPRTLDNDSDSSSDEDEPASPPWVPSDSVLSVIIEEEADEMLADMYETVRTCPCQNKDDQKAPAISSVWKLPETAVSEMHKGTPRATVVVQVAA